MEQNRSSVYSTFASFPPQLPTFATSKAVPSLSVSRVD